MSLLRPGVIKQHKPTNQPTIANKVIGLNTMAGRPGLPGVKCISAAAATVAANGGLWTFGFKGL